MEEILLSPHVSWIAVLSAELTPAMSMSLSHQGTQKWAQSSSCGLTSAELYCLEYYGVSIYFNFSVYLRIKFQL